MLYHLDLLSLLPIVSKLFVMSFKTTLEFIFTSRHSFHVVLKDNLRFFSHSGKFFVMPKYLNFFLMDSTIDLEIANWFEIISWLVEVNNSLSQVNTKFFCLLHCVFHVRITMVTLYAPCDILCWNYHKCSPE